MAQTVSQPAVYANGLTLALDGNEWSIWRSSCFTASKITSRYPLNRRLDILGKRKISGPSLEQNPRLHSPYSSHNTDYAILVQANASMV